MAKGNVDKHDGEAAGNTSGASSSSSNAAPVVHKVGKKNPNPKKKKVSNGSSSSELSSGKLGSDSSDDESDSTSTESEEEGAGEGEGDDDSHMDECYICDDGGELILCDAEGCYKSYHAECVGVDINTLPLTWHCPSCCTKNTTKKKKGSGMSDDKATSATTATSLTMPTSNVSKKGGGGGDLQSNKSGNKNRPNEKNDAMDEEQSPAKKRAATSDTKNVEKKAKNANAANANISAKPLKLSLDSFEGQKENKEVASADKNSNPTSKASNVISEKNYSATKPLKPTGAGSEGQTGVIEVASSTEQNDENETPPEKESIGNKKSTTAPIVFRRQLVKNCTVPDCSNKGQTCTEHGPMKRTCTVPECTNFPQVGTVCVKHGAKVKRCNHEGGCSNQVVRLGKCRKHFTEYTESLRASTSQLGSLGDRGEGEVGPLMSSEEKIKKGIAPSPPSAPLVNPTFRTVTVPDGVTPGEVFHVLLGKGKILGVICPEGVNPGNKMIVLEPGNLEPPIPPSKIAKMNAQRLLHGINKSESPTIIANAFWNVLWPNLHNEGWTFTRQMHYNFGATKFYVPGAGAGSTAVESSLVVNVHYFETIKDVITRVTQIPKYEKYCQDFEAEVTKKKQEKAEKAARRSSTISSSSGPKEKREKKRVPVVQQVSDLDAWKYVGEREHIDVGNQYQVRTLPRAGSYVSGENEEYIRDKLSDPAELKASLTPSSWYDMAKEPGFAEQFHKSVIETKKQMPELALTLGKPVGFLLWYYYHKYKVPSNSEKYQSLKQLMNELKKHENSDECAICEDGGDLLCCETCTDSYHLECLGLSPSDVEDVEEWTCLACTRKRKLLLSPPKSPKNRRESVVTKNLAESMEKGS